MNPAIIPIAKCLRNGFARALMGTNSVAKCLSIDRWRHEAPPHNSFISLKKQLKKKLWNWLEKTFLFKPSIIASVK